MGQHVVSFAERFPGIIWQPSDPDEASRASIAAWRDHSGASNILPPMDIDVAEASWERALDGSFDAILAINLIHISPWRVTQGLLRGAGVLLEPHGLLYLYGPYKRDGVHTAESNARFEEWLKAQSPEYGVRDMEEIIQVAEENELNLEQAVDMPSNNFSLLFRKQ